MSTAAVAPRAFMLAGSSGALCAVYFEPRAGVAPLGDVLVVPAFAEEMNRCRAMVALQARALAELGVGTLVVDPHGTGDSAGEFSQASWAQWRQDLLLAVAWLDAHGKGCRALLALRLGAIMAAELVRECPRVSQLVLWQPVLSGKTFYTQFLRIRLAAEMNQPDRIKSTNELRAMSAQGQLVEVSGYEVGPTLAAELDGLNFDLSACAERLAIDWFEVQTDAEASLAPASQKTIDTLRSSVASLHAQAVTGPAFWHVHEREVAPALIAATAMRVGNWVAAPPPGPVERDCPAEVANPTELPLFLPCGPDSLSACLHQGAPAAKRGVVIVVAGGPQYRAGAHRQFVSLARKLAGVGHPVLRFDLRGMGDSTGSYLGFEHSAPDIRAAIDGLLARQADLREVVLVGECESASGILFYAWQDQRVTGVVLVNPWVRTAEGQAQVILKDYYLDRLRSPAFWRKLRSGEFRLGESLLSLRDVVRAYVRGKRMFAKSSLGHVKDDLAGMPLPVKTATGLSRFHGRVMLLMSGHDYIAREFDEVTAASRAWDGLLESERVVRKEVDGADHTFSKRAWKDSASDAVVAWVDSW